MSLQISSREIGGTGLMGRYSVGTQCKLQPFDSYVVGNPDF